MAGMTFLGAPSDPHAELLRRRAALFAQPLAHGDIPRWTSDAIGRVEREIAMTPPRTLEGALRQLEFAWEDAKDDMHLSPEQRLAMQSAMDLLRRLADP